MSTTLSSAPENIQLMFFNETRHSVNTIYMTVNLSLLDKWSWVSIAK